jgi:hypothetical protein
MTILLGLAGMAWKYLKPKVPAAKAQLAKARERVEPALRDATNKVRSASKEAAESVRDVSLSAAETADAVAGAIAEPDAGATPASNAQQAHATSQRG